MPKHFRDRAPPILLQAMRHVGHTDLTPEEQAALDDYLDSTREGLLDALMARRINYEPPVHLTPRQAEIVSYWAHGWKNADIARFLHISPSTVASHTEVIHGRLHTHTRAHAVAVALRNGWISLPEP